MEKNNLRKKRVEQHGRRFTVLENHYRCLDVMGRLCACFTPEISRGNFLSCHAGFFFCIPILFLVELITLSFGCRFDTGICHDTSLDYVLCQSSECGGRSTLQVGLLYDSLSKTRLRLIKRSSAMIVSSSRSSLTKQKEKGTSVSQGN